MSYLRDSLRANMKVSEPNNTLMKKTLAEALNILPNEINIGKNTISITFREVNHLFLYSQKRDIFIEANISRTGFGRKVCSMIN